MEYYSDFKKHFILLTQLINESIKGNNSNPELMLIPLDSMLHTVNKMVEHYTTMEEYYKYVKCGTILEIGDEVKGRPDFDINRYVRSLEKEVFRICNLSKENRKQWQENYANTQKIRHALWISRAERARLEKYSQTGYDTYRSQHPNSKVTMKQWYGSWWKVERLCQEYAKKFEYCT